MACQPNADSNEAPSCEITSPKDGESVNISKDLVIMGKASDSDGKIATVVLKVAGKKVEDVTEVPFIYTIPAGDLQEGNLTISLEVTDDGGLSSEHTVTVRVEDLAKLPVCKITAPEHGAQLNYYRSFTIKGEGDPVAGTMARVTLTIGDDVITSVTSVPFEYTVEAKSYPIGALPISLEVENSGNLTAKDLVSVDIADLNELPKCEITSPVNGAAFDPEEAVVIKGTGSDKDGTIERVTLKINTEKITEVKSVPFEFTVPASLKNPGNLYVTLEVEDNDGGTAIDSRLYIINGLAGSFIDSRDNKVYSTVQMGTQIWMAENLAYLPSVNPGADGSELAGEENKLKFYVYGYDGTNVNEAKSLETYQQTGVLYNWWAALNGDAFLPHEERMKVPSGVQGICPDGWHLPSRGEWWVLQQWCNNQIPDTEGIMGSDRTGTPDRDPSERLIKNVMKRLKKRNAGWKAVDQWADEFPGVLDQPTDEWGFGGMASGTRLNAARDDSYFYYYAFTQETQLYFWTAEWSKVLATEGAGSVSFGSKYELSFNGGLQTYRGHSVRCVKDE